MRLQQGDLFNFVGCVEAISVTSPFGGWLGFHVPAQHAKQIYKPQLLGEIITIEETTTFIVEKAYWSITGWCIRARSSNNKISYVSFHQFRDWPEEENSNLIRSDAKLFPNGTEEKYFVQVVKI